MITNILGQVNGSLNAQIPASSHDVQIEIAPVAKTAAQAGLLSKISTGASSMARWCFSTGANFVKGAAGFSLIQTILSGGATISLAKNALYHSDKFFLNRYEIFGNVNRILILFKNSGRTIPDSVDPSQILTSDCPKEEYLRQMSLVTGESFSASDINRANLLFLVAGPSIIEESIFRGLIQDVLLKRCVAKFVGKVAPNSISLVDSKIYTVCRILLSSASFAAIHNMNRLILSDEYVDFQIYYTFGLGIILGAMKEVGGLAPCIGAHAINNLTALLPSLLAKC